MSYGIKFDIEAITAALPLVLVWQRKDTYTVFDHRRTGRRLSDDGMSIFKARSLLRRPANQSVFSSANHYCVFQSKIYVVEKAASLLLNSAVPAGWPRRPSGVESNRIQRSEFWDCTQLAGSFSITEFPPMARYVSKMPKNEAGNTRELQVSVSF